MATHPSRWLFGILAAILAFAAPVHQTYAKKMLIRDPQRYKFKIDPATKLADLLPTPPMKHSKTGPYLNEDLARVTEVAFGEPVRAGKFEESSTERETAHVIAKIKHLSVKDPDGFMKALIGERADLRGLPLLLGEACKTDSEQAALFAEVVELVHRSESNLRSERFVEPENFWPEFEDSWKEEGKLREKAPQERTDRAKVAALMQVFGPAPAPYRAGLAKYLGSIQHIDATRALVKLALFSSEESVQQAAIAGLKGRKAEDIAPLLMDGFRYPLPAVSKRAADALVKLQVKSVLGDLVRVLEEPDPRAPRDLDSGETIVRELVRINHHRNCLLCHAPADSDKLSREILSAAVPLPDQSLSRSGGYRFGSSPDIFVRTDVTYLRQDFSMVMKVEKASPWPELQRFDFLVRTREVTADRKSVV